MLLKIRGAAACQKREDEKGKETDMAQSTLYIHIGTPKTGTTALQGFLAKNRKTLQEHGAVFPDFGLVYKGVAKNRNAHFLVATKDPFHAKEMGVCMKILKQQAALYPKILISDESIWTFYGHPDVETAPFWKKLKETLDDDQRKLLLRLTDCQNDYRQEAALCGFLSGWRVANGLRDEMDAVPRFSIADEDERRALEQFE